MNFTALFINRPVMTTLVMLGILIFGITAFFALPVSDLPNVDFPSIQVSASLPGASPETMAAAVATPLEKQFSTIAGIDSMTSTSLLGNTQITLHVQSQPKHRRSSAGRSGGNSAGTEAIASGYAESADLSEGQPGGPADSLSGADRADAADVFAG